MDAKETKKKKLVITSSVVGAIVVVLVVTFGALAISGVFRGFDAPSYVEAILDHTFKGDVEAALRVTDGTTEEVLEAQYEESMVSFIDSSLMNGVEVDEELKAKYITTCKDIFAAMKYDVQDAKKISGKEFQVTVTYQASDVFIKFVEVVQAENQRIEDKYEKGEYRGTTEEIELEMQQEFLNNMYTMFEEAYKTMEYGEEETIVLSVKKGENDLYKLNEEEIAEFITKIMRLDEIQD